LVSPPATLGDDDQIRVEATLREIDAGFAPESMSEELRDVRTRLAAVVGP
jgi:hypothetical protein